MKRNIYKLLSNAKQSLFALSLTVFSGTAYSQTTYTLNYTGNVQTLNLQAGPYNIEMWGGNGYTETAGYNGRGGYSSGTLTLASAQPVYIYVGGLGSYPATGVTSNTWTFNGGGIGYPASNPSYGNGGGATDIRTVGGTWDDPTSLASRAIVAGGGGAGRSSSYIGAHGGGLTGGTGTYYTPDQTSGPTGGSQTAGGSNTGYTSGLTLATLGKAMTWDGNALTSTYLAGGGGGYYGGASGRVAGGGGSSYIGGVTSGTTIMYGQPGFVPNPSTTGNGMVIITQLCNITLTASGSNSLNPSICSGQSLTLTTNGISNYAWSTGNTTTSSIVVSPTITTVYTLSATSPLNCTASTNITVTVNSAAPALTFTTAPGSSSVCLGQTATLTAGGAVSYTLAGGPGNLTNGQTFTPTATSSYTITGQNGCGTSSVATTISVSVLPVTAVASSTLICSGTPATLTAGGATNYTWTSPTVTSNNASYIVNPVANTTYSLYGVTGPCAGTTTISVSTKALPTLSVVASSSVICNGNSANLSVVGTATSYVWNPGNQTGSSISVTPTTSTLYSVIGTNSANCNSSASQVIIVNAKPVINVAASDLLVCPHGSSTLTATGAATYLWGGVTPGSVLVVNPTSTTAYTVAGTSTNTCSNETVITVSVFDPTLSLSSSTAVCRGTNVNINASGMDTYQWSNGSGFSSISVTPTTTTTYSVNSSSTQGAVTCSLSGAVTVSVNPNPTVTASGSPTMICRGQSAVITASGAVTYTWAGSTPEVAASLTVTPTADQTYSVAGADANGCKGAGTVLVRVTGCVGIADHLLNTANVSVYPNPSNGEFTISSDQAISLQISNELGQVIKTITLNKTGETANVSNLADGIYFITGQNANGGVKQKLIITK